ncbi:MAG: hypothetical protein MRY72_02490, partial [Aquisalinus sp.]|nr:hypothetical protein [Aquisalinus sp.]
MIDPRFYHTSEPLLTSKVITELGRKVLSQGGGSQVERVADVTDENLNGAVVFLNDPKMMTEGVKSVPTICLVSPKVAQKINLSETLYGATILESDNPRGDFAILAAQLHKSIAEEIGYGDHQKATIAETAKIDSSAAIGEGAVIEDNVTICANSVIGPGVIIGAGSIIGPNVS